LPAPDPEIAAFDVEDLEGPVWPDYVNVFMPYVNLRYFDNLSFAFVNPPLPHPDEFILQAAYLGCSLDWVALYSSSVAPVW
jgi:hypothetical protein